MTLEKYCSSNSKATAETLEKVSCFVSPRNGETPLSLSQGITINIDFHNSIESLQNICDATDGPHISTGADRFIIDYFWGYKFNDSNQDCYRIKR